MAKKILLLMLTLALVLGTVISFTACDEEPEEPTCTAHADADKNNKCDSCGADYTAPCTEHTDENKDHNCDYCGESCTVECTTHTDENEDKLCDYCGLNLDPGTPDIPCTRHADTDGDLKCDFCGKDMPCAECVDTDNNGKCDRCGKDVVTEKPDCTECVDANTDGKCDVCGKDVVPDTPACTDHTDTDKNHKCDKCGADYTAPCTEHTDTDKNDKCDYCGAAVACDECTDANSDGKCDVCGKDVAVGAVLITGGEAKFQIVVQSGVTSEVIRAANELAKTIKDLGGGTVNVVFDEASSIAKYEVFFGEVTSRGEKYHVNPYQYGKDGYAITAIDDKVSIVGGCEDTLLDAIKEFKEKVLKIRRNTSVLTDVTMTEAMNIIEKQDGYKVDDVTFAGVGIREFVIGVDLTDFNENEIALAIRENLYDKMGVWLPIVSFEAENEHVIRVDLVKPKQASANGFDIDIKDGNVSFVCGFQNKFSEQAIAFIRTKILNSGSTSVTFAEGFHYDVDVRNIYYSDYGAVGDGVTDDFFAIMAAHEEANAWGHTVHAGSKDRGGAGFTYYFGKGSGSNTITIGTDTYWHGCRFIWDDSEIAAPPYIPNTNTPTGERGDDEYYASIFQFVPEKSSISYSGSRMPFTSLYEGATDLGGWAPGERVLIQIYNSNIKHFIRYGANQNNGSSQNEILVIEADGTIAEETPVQWSYDVVTSMTVRYISDEPVTLSGADTQGEFAFIDTIVNDAESYYTYYKRNFLVTRSNVTIERLQHKILEEDERDSGAPYSGFIQINNCNDIIVQDCDFQCPKGYSTTGAAGTPVGMGSYEFTATSSNNVLWRRCTQSNFYQPDGSVKYDGMVGTNYCKNLTYDEMFVCSFDAHCGTYNATVTNSTIEHLNFIGEGTVTIKNTKLYTDGAAGVLNLRSDYGSTWEGNVIIDGLTLYKHKNATSTISICIATYTNHDFGYITHLPEKIEINNIKTVTYDFDNDAPGGRKEWIVDENTLPIYLARNLASYTYVDISDPNADMEKKPNDLKACTCGTFNDTDGDGLCENLVTSDDGGRQVKCAKPETVDNTTNLNPYMPIEEVYITNSPGVTFIFHKTPQFQDMKVYIDGEQYDWWDNPTVTIPEATE